MRAPEPALSRSAGISLALALLVGLLAAVLRLQVVPSLPLEWDEGVTLRAAYVYADAIENEHWSEIPRIQINNEHPPAVKILYGARLSGTPRDTWGALHAGQEVPVSLSEEVTALRRLSAFAGAAEAAGVALVNPLAGIFLAANSYHRRYTSLLILEGVAGLFGVASVVLFGFAWRSRPGCEQPELRWAPLVLSAMALGLAAASKYIYGLPLLILFPFLWVRANRPGPLVGFGVIAAATFFVAHPGLWNHPWQLIAGTLSFHANFASEHARPFWHPLALMSHATSDDHHAQFFGSTIDRIFLFFAVLGIPLLARKRPIWFAWALVAMAFLLLWPTKWAHYQLIATPPLAMCAAFGIETALRPWSRWRGTKELGPSS